jgi:3-hydroxybutyrate dehydrogenase
MLEGKGALVMGFSGSIGTALAEVGANVMLNGYRNPEAIEAQRDRIIADYGTKVDYRVADLNEYGDIESMVADRETSLGSLDIVINNAGVRHMGKVQDFPNDAWKRAMRVNLSACFYTTRQAIPRMLERN